MPRVHKALKSKVNDVIRVLKDKGTADAIRYLMEDLNNPDLAVVIAALYKDVGLIHANRVNLELRNTGKGFWGVLQQKRLGYNTDWIAFLQDYLSRNLFTKITFEMNSTTRAALLKAIQSGVADGKGVDEIVRSIQDWPFLYYQAARITRTEINRAANVGSAAASKTFEFEQVKEWIAAKDSRTRGNPINGAKDHANHWSLDGVTIDQDDYFQDPRNGDLMSFPGDPSASAASVINCRCTLGYTPKRDENGKLIPKKEKPSRITVILPGELRRPQITTI